MQRDFLNPYLGIWSVWGGQMGLPGREAHSELSHFTPGGPCDWCYLSPDGLPPHTLPLSL